MAPRFSEAEKGKNKMSEDSGTTNSRVTDKADPFQERLDRHGRPFGERTSTRQTRNPPPEKSSNKRADNALTWREKESETSKQNYSSPQYSRERGITIHSTYRNIDLFPQQSREVWRPKLVRVTEEKVPESPPEKEDQIEDTVSQCQVLVEPNPLIPSHEEAMQVLQEATRQYLSHHDPVEAAARRQRVHHGDANGQMEEAVDSMIKAAIERQRLLEQRHLLDSNPVTPPSFPTSTT
ncbi:hypothetical protein Bca101_020658 [Brassica carinata]